MKKKKSPDKPEKSIFDTNKIKSNIITVKTSLKSILKDYDVNYIIIDKMVKDMNNIAIISYLFIRLYILYCYKYNKDIPELTSKNILYFIKACGKRDNRGRTAKDDEFLKELETFYDNHFKHLINEEKYDLVNKSQLLSYLSIQMETAYKNNIKEHFITRIRRFMNITKPIKEDLIKEQEEKIKDLKQYEIAEKYGIVNKCDLKLINDKYKKLIKEVNHYYSDLWNSTKNNILLDNIDKIPEVYKEYAEWIKSNYLPKTYDKNYGYDVKANPNKYISYTLKINDYIEEHTDKKLFQSLSLRNSIVPSYITIDSATLIYYFFNGEKHLNKAINENKEYIWDKIFKTHKKVMNIKDYHIDTIQTDGIGVSLIFKKNGLNKFQLSKKVSEDKISYLTDLSNEDLEIAKNKKIISLDPGKQNLIYMLDEQHNKFRYTASQRRVESNRKRNSYILRHEKIKNDIIQEETILSAYNCKTNDINKFSEYIKEKLILNKKLKDFYESELIRKMKWRSFICKRQSEDKLLNTIEKKYGKSEDLLISYGNWNNSKQMKHIMPTLGIGMRKLLEKKFTCVLFDEFRTSKLCCKCHNELENYNSLHHILICSNCKSDGCESKNITFINRDINGCKNMLDLSIEWINHKTRNKKFCRTTDNDVPKKATPKKRVRKTLSS